MAEVVTTFANSLNTVLSKLPYEHPMEGASVYKTNVEIADRDIAKAFGAVAEAERRDKRDGARSTNKGASLVFTDALKDSGYVLDDAKRAIETNHPGLASFTDRDRRYLLHLAADIRLGQLEALVRGHEATSAYYGRSEATSPTLEEIVQIKTFKAELSQPATAPAPDVSKV